MKVSKGERKKENTRTNRDLGKIKKGPGCHGARKWCGVCGDTRSSKRTI